MFSIVFTFIRGVKPFYWNVGYSSSFLTVDLIYLLRIFSCSFCGCWVFFSPVSKVLPLRVSSFVLVGYSFILFFLQSWNDRQSFLKQLCYFIVVNRFKNCESLWSTSLVLKLSLKNIGQPPVRTTTFVNFRWGKEYIRTSFRTCVPSVVRLLSIK